MKSKGRKMTTNGITSTNSAGNTFLEAQTKSTATEEDDPLGRDAFLTMLVAQLKNQDPLNPLEGTDFSTQLAQFSSLEQMFNMNDNLEAILNSVDSKGDNNLLDYIGKEILSEDNAIELKNGEASGCNFSIEEPAEVMLTIYDSSGTEIRNLYPGYKDAGTYEIEWDGLDHTGTQVSDGTYLYEVTAIGEDGGKISATTTISGTVTGLTYKQGAAYLMVNDILVNPETVLDIKLPSEGDAE